PESRIVYVDNDPIVLTHARALLSSTPEGAAAFLDADLREPELILKSAARTLDLGQPAALMLLIILHLIPDAEHPERIVTRLMSALPAGSHLVLSHPARDVQPAAMAEMTRRVNERMRGAMATLRTRDEVATLFGGLKMVEPGVVQPQQWRPDPATETPAEVTAWCGVALKS
ncbi:MAG TPA: SAM-dependent methyltransferase, partial [Streptosporangiaceae bacterium]|nr:SAM-dependent methyltransferase [Streptosporangiaceae bacterium]